jgi:outer membrane protein OmpA-like peptidoglycan-associated protein
MPALTLQSAERTQKRWLLGAIGIALLFHGGAAGVLGYYHLHGIEIPSDHTSPTGPFTVKRIEISPNALKSDQSDPTTKLPQPEPPRNPAEFNLDANLVEKALQAPLPKLSAPAVPEPDRVIASTDLGRDLPFTQSDSSKLTEEISKVQPSTAAAGPVASAQLAQDVISNSAGYPHPGATPGQTTTGDGALNQVPGFGNLASGFKPGNPAVSNLPDPVLLRLPSDVLFDFDSAVLKPQASALLSQAVGLITKYPSADVQIDGYSDSFGKPDYNLSLSQQRAQAVQAWLQDRVGQSAYKFRSTGHGSSDYVVPAGGSIDAQQPNRRVEILIQALKV